MQVLSFIQIICPILLVQSFTIYPQISERHRQKSRRQIFSVSHDNKNERDPRSLSVISLLSSNHDDFDDDRLASASQLSDDMVTTTLLERKRFIEGLTATLSAIFGLQPAWGTTIDPKTGIRLPDPGEIEASIPANWKDDENPISSSDAGLGSNSNSNTQFARLDSKPDSFFYQDPRFVEHVDENAVKLVTKYVSNTAIQPGRDAAVLDLCSSWNSHIDGNIAGKMTRIAGLGMNAKELDRNTALTDWIVQDLNDNPQLSKYENESFDVVLCQLSIDYLTKPLQVLKEVGRILKVGGRVHIIFSNRLFLSKAVGLWTGGDDIDHAYYVGSYLNFCEGGFEDIKAIDLSNRKGGKDKRIVGDPLFVVSATKGKD
jgi:SAM-dependent methyltransferase